MRWEIYLAVAATKERGLSAPIRPMRAGRVPETQLVAHRPITVLIAESREGPLGRKIC